MDEEKAMIGKSRFEYGRIFNGKRYFVVSKQRFKPDEAKKLFKDETGRWEVPEPINAAVRWTVGFNAAGYRTNLWKLYLDRNGEEKGYCPVWAFEIK